MKDMKRIIAALLAAASMMLARAEDITVTCWHPYTPPAEAFGIGCVDYVNEPVIYANGKPAKDGFYYVGIYEGLTGSASLIRVGDKATADRLLFYITKYFSNCLDIMPVIKAHLMYDKYATATVEENLPAATKESYMDVAENIISWIDYIATEEDTEVELPVNGSEDRTRWVTCNVTEDYETFLGRLKYAFEDTLPSVRERFDDYL